MTIGVQIGRSDAASWGRRSPSEAGLAGPADVTRARVAEARSDLGRELAARRKAAGLTQTAFARRVGYSRSTVANLEVGRQCAPRLWERADQELGAAGALVGGFNQVNALERALQAQVTRARQRHRVEQHAPVVADGCGCPVVVGRWTGRESRALREALRMSVRAFAEYLGMSTASVTCWENGNPTPLRLATQAVLDQALKLADAEVKARFGLILANPSDGVSGTGAEDRRSVAGGSVVTALHGRERTRTA